MSQEKSAEIIDLSASRAAAQGDGAGPFLTSARLAAGLDIADVAAATKIKTAHIEAIETGNTAALPATPYAVGFVRVYAAYLGLDADAIAIEFRNELTAARPAPQAQSRPATPDYETSPNVKIVSLFGIALILCFAIWIAIQIAGKGGTADNAEAVTAPRIVLSDTRAEAPRPRINTAPTHASREYEVVPIPPVGGDPVVAEAAEENPLEELSAPAEAMEEDAPTEAPTLSALQSAPDAPVDDAFDVAPQATPTPDQPVVVDARLVRSIGPRYPARCERAAGALETVTVMFDVNATGRPTNARVTAASDDCFEDAAVEAVGKWRFNPRTVDGAPRPQKNLEATLNFRR